MLFGGLGGQVIGATAYMQLDGAWYLEPVATARCRRPSCVTSTPATTAA